MLLERSSWEEDRVRIPSERITSFTAAFPIRKLGSSRILLKILKPRLNERLDIGLFLNT